MTTSNSVGKGSKPRPITISKEQYQKNWDRIFKKGANNAKKKSND